MLIDRFKVGQSFGIGDYVVKIVSIRGQQVELGFLGPEEVQAQRTQGQAIARPGESAKMIAPRR